MQEPARFHSPEYQSVISDVPASTHCSLSTAALNTMKQAAEATYPLEACGLLIGTLNQHGWRIEEARQVKNLNTERAADRFQLDPAAYQAIDRELRGSEQEIIGVFHSHPDCPARPSPTDLDSAWEGYLYPIISTHNGNAIDILYWTLAEHHDKRCFSPVTQMETQI